MPSLLIKVTANGNSFQMYSILKMNTVATTGIIIGSTTDLARVSSPVPSIMAASSISLGNPRRKPVNNNVLKEMEVAI
ncbi:hypothetical protein D3C85_1807890 [compost metagenome]